VRRWACEIARHRCVDCGVNVIRIGDYYMLRSAIWQDQLGLGWHDNLCIACVEQRLGRKLRLTNWYPLIATDDSILGINVASEEITERKRMEAALGAKPSLANSPTVCAI
jgi:hypothetical protein